MREWLEANHKEHWCKNYHFCQGMTTSWKKFLDPKLTVQLETDSYMLMVTDYYNVDTLVVRTMALTVLNKPTD